MRSETELRWVRAKNNVGQRKVVSDWHAIVPGFGAEAPPPGTACETGLVGSLQFDTHQGVQTLDGRRHEVCWNLALAYIAAVDPSPGPREPDPEHHTFAPPGSQSADS